MSSAVEALPRQERLKKLLMMTTSANDSEALAAIRMANTMLATAGWSWEKLIDGRITVVEDPFKNLGVPVGRNNRGPVPTTPTPPAPPPPPPRQGSWAQPISSTPNQYASWCHCCGNEVVANAGFRFKTSPAAVSWSVICTPCNTTAFIYTSPAKRKYNKRQTSVSDLA